MNPTPSTTARTETAETVTVPRSLSAQADKLVAEAAFSDEDTQAAFDWIDDATPVLRTLAAAPALSPQHPVGVREAPISEVERLSAVYAKATNYYVDFHPGLHSESSNRIRDGIRAVLAALSHPPAQDAPGAGRQITEFGPLDGEPDYPDMEEHEDEPLEEALREILTGGQGDDDGPQIMPDFEEGQSVLSMVHACIALLETRRDVIEGYANTEAQLRHRLVALDPFPPLPEADGEVVAKLNKLEEDYKNAISVGGAHLNLRFWPVLSEARAALVSALRERDEARTELREEHLLHVGALRERNEERAAREKAEQVAAGLRERIESTAALIERVGGLPAKVGYGSEYAVIAVSDPRGFAAALRASTEEGKTATPSVKDEEAGR